MRTIQYFAFKNNLRVANFKDYYLLCFHTNRRACAVLHNADYVYRSKCFSKN